jgi:hypothetical protein
VRIRPLAGASRTEEDDMKWATRTNMRTDRGACSWLIRRFIDPEAEFSFFDQAVLLEEAKKIGARTFDAKGSDFGHVGMHCSFETMLIAFDLWGKDPALDHMAEIINASDISIKLYDFTIMEGFTVWALAQGFAESMPDDDEKLEKCVPMYEALYRWCQTKTAKLKQTHYMVPVPEVYGRAGIEVGSAL